MLGCQAGLLTTNGRRYECSPRQKPTELSKEDPRDCKKFDLLFEGEYYEGKFGSIFVPDVVISGRVEIVCDFLDGREIGFFIKVYQI